MKSFILIFIIVVCSCLDNKRAEPANDNFETQKKNSFYDIILLSEFKTIDLEQYFLDVTVTDKITEFHDLYNAVLEGNYMAEDESRNLRRLETVIEPYPRISSEVASIIGDSKVNTTNKKKISYEFSMPYRLSNGRTLIFNTVSFMNPASGDIKGGVERVFVFLKKGNSWVINKKIKINDF